jgi:hypothetical protein
MNVERRVAIVVDPELGDQVAELRAARPVWVIDSPVNRVAWYESESEEPSSAIFSASDAEARKDNLLARLDDVDLHFGADSYPDSPYVGIRVFGLSLSEQVEGQLKGGAVSEHSVRRRRVLRLTSRDRKRLHVTRMLHGAVDASKTLVK